MEREEVLTVDPDGYLMGENGYGGKWMSTGLTGLSLIASCWLNLWVAYGGYCCLSNSFTDQIPCLIRALLFSSVIDSLLSQCSSFSSASPFICRFSFAVNTFGLLLQLNFVFLIVFNSLWTNSFVTSPHLFCVAVPLVIAFLFVCPFFLFPQLSTVHYFIDRNSCDLTGDHLAYPGFLLIGYAAPWPAMMYYLTAKRCPKVSSSITEEQLNSESVGQYYHKYTLLLILLSAVLWIPYIVFRCYTSFITFERLNGCTDSNNNTVVVTGAFDTVFSWAKAQFNVFSPILVLVCFENVRKRCIEILGSIKINKFRGKIRESKYSTSEQSAPVLFCTTEGLMLRTVLPQLPNIKFSISHCDRVEEKLSGDGSSISTNEITADPANRKKIVRFAHTVQEIPMRDITDWAHST